MGQILVQFAAPFFGPRLRRLEAVCRRLLHSAPFACWQHNGKKSVFDPGDRHARSRLVVEAKAISADRGVCSKAHGQEWEALAWIFGAGAVA